MFLVEDDRRVSADLQVFGSCSAFAADLSRLLKEEDFAKLQDLKGSWNLAFNDKEKTILVSDSWGTRHLYYMQQNNQFFYSENLDDLFLSLQNVKINPGALARFLLEDFSHPEETLFDDIKKVKPGTALVWSKGQTQIFEWSKSRLKTPATQSLKSLISAWENELTQNLRTLLPQKLKWGIFVSGGLDSCGLVALCMDLIHKKNWPIEIQLYHLTTDHSESDDQGFCEKIARHYQIPLFNHQTTPSELRELFFEWKHKKSSLPFFPTLQMFEPLMKKAAQNGCSGLLFGYGADEQWTLPAETLGLDFLTHFQWRELLRTLKNTNEPFNHLKKILTLWLRHKAPEFLKNRWQAWTSYGIPFHLNPNQIFQEQRRQLKERIQNDITGFYSYSQKQLFLRNATSGNNSYNLSCHMTLAQSYGLQVYLPYLSPELLNISIQTHHEMLSMVQDKLVLRELLKNKLPEEIRRAPKFQDYCQLSFKTALLLQKETQNSLIEEKWLASKTDPGFDDDSFFEVLFAEKLLNTVKEINDAKDFITKFKNEDLPKTNH